MSRYMKSYEISDELCEKHNLPLKEGCFVDNVKAFMSADDDTNYLVMAQEIVENYGRDFTSADVSVACCRWNG